MLSLLFKKIHFQRNLDQWHIHWQQMRNLVHVSQGFPMRFPNAGWPLKIDLAL